MFYYPSTYLEQRYGIMVGVTEERMQTSIIEATRQLSREQRVELLFRALFMLSVRGVATPEQVRIMLEIQEKLNPCLKECLRVA